MLTRAVLLALLLAGCVRRVPLASPPAYCSPVPAGMVLGGWIVALPEDPDKSPAVECYYFRAPAPDVPDGQPVPVRR